MEYLFYTSVALHACLLIYTILPLSRASMPPTQDNFPPFSVVVCAKNELENLKKLVPVLLAQQYPHYEIIIILDRCTDQSKAYLDSLQSPKLKCIEVQKVPAGFHGKKYGLTKGIESAQHEWILLTDADCQPHTPHWISSFATRAIPGKELILGVSPYSSQTGPISLLTNYETLLTAMHYLASALRGKAYMGVGRNIAYRKSTFLKVRGYQPYAHVPGGDDDLLVQKMANAHNTVVLFTRDSLTYSPPERKWREYLWQKTRHLSVGKYYRAEVKWMHALRGAVHLIVWASFLYLLLLFPVPSRIIVLFTLLILAKGLFFYKIARKLGVPFLPGWFPVLDFVYAFFLPLIGLRAGFVKNIKWK